MHVCNSLSVMMRGSRYRSHYAERMHCAFEKKSTELCDRWTAHSIGEQSYISISCCRSAFFNPLMISS